MVVTLVAAWLVASRNTHKRSWGFWCFVASNVLWVVWGGAIAGTLFGGLVVPTLVVYGPELFPTRLRGRANGVITAAGVIFAGSMFAMMSGSVTTLVQMGFTIGAGLLLDTFVVRTLVVPASAALLGPLLWPAPKSR